MSCRDCVCTMSMRICVVCSGCCCFGFHRQYDGNPKKKYVPIEIRENRNNIANAKVTVGSPLIRLCCEVNEMNARQSIISATLNDSLHPQIQFNSIIIQLINPIDFFFFWKMGKTLGPNTLTSDLVHVIILELSIARSMSLLISSTSKSITSIVKRHQVIRQNKYICKRMSSDLRLGERERLLVNFKPFPD